jgi:N-acetylglucosaminyl-diphospho-decaprenol L-rhamnosyltransferase
MSAADGGRHPAMDIVIVNWNTGNYLRECLASIASSDGDVARLARVTVVDNASSDDSASGLDDFALPLELIRNQHNIGFAAACNQGAAGSESDYLLFLNPDTRVFPDTLTAVTGFMGSEQARGIGICGVQLVDPGGTPEISCSRFPTLRVLFGKITGLDVLLPGLFPSHHLSAAETRESRVVDQVIGAFFFVRRELFLRLGGFDPRFFIYFEEVDFALRARQRGWRSFFLKDATVVHTRNVSSNQVRGMRLYHSLRSRLLFARRHWPRWQANVLVALTLTIEPAVRLANAGFQRRWSDIRSLSAYGRLLADLVPTRRPDE